MTALPEPEFLELQVTAIPLPSEILEAPRTVCVLFYPDLFLDRILRPTPRDRTPLEKRSLMTPGRPRRNADICPS